MEQTFYRDYLVEHHGLRVLVPSSSDCDVMHRIIYEELCLGHVLDSSRLEYIPTRENEKIAGIAQLT